MRQVISNLGKSRYVRAVAYLSGGQFIAAGLPLLAAPIVGRLYLPADYGAFGLYSAIAAVLGTISVLQLHQGIITEASERRAEILVHLCIRLAACTGIASLLVVVPVFATLGERAAFHSVRMWILILPISVFASGAAASLAAFANRSQHYRFLARVSIMSVALSVPASILFGWLGWGANGLFAAYFLSQTVAWSSYLYRYKKMIKHHGGVSSAKLFAVAHRHRRFAIYTLPSEFVSALNLGLPTYVVTYLGAVATLGSFNRARQLASMPASVLGQSIAAVFRQQASKQLAESGSCRPIFVKTLSALMLVGGPATIVGIIAAPRVVPLFLGPNWTEAGKITQILLPMIFLQFVHLPLANVYFLIGRQRRVLLIQGLFFLFALIFIGLAITFSGTAQSIILAYVLASSCVYALIIADTYILTGQTASTAM